MMTHNAVKLHFAVASNDANGLKEIIENSTDRLVIYKNESAVRAALKQKQFMMYEILIKNSFDLSPNEDFEDIIKDYDDDEKTKVRNIHVDCSVKNFPEILKSKCELKHSTPGVKSQKYFAFIYQSLQRLAKIEWIALILQTITFADRLNIVFDFDRDSVNHIDPFTCNNTKGICYYLKGEIFIGAKGLFENSPEKVCTVMGVMAHEFCHFVVQLLYDNQSKPYRENDLESAEEFQKVFEKSKAKKDEEEIIRLVFDCYPEESQHAELIVRVIHILAVYSLDEHREKLQQCKETFSELFDFFQDNFVTDLKRELPMIEAKLKVKDANEICGLLKTLKSYNLPFELEVFNDMEFGIESDEKAQILTSNWIDATLKGIFTKLEMKNQLEGKIFAKLEMLKIDQIAEKIMKALRKFNESTIIVQCGENSEAEIEEIKQKVAKNNTRTKMIFVNGQETKFIHHKAKKVEHLWSQLTEQSKNIFLKKKVNFQGLKINFYDFVVADSKAIEFINLNDLHTEKVIKIGSEIKFDEVKIYVERKFSSNLGFFEKQLSLSDIFLTGSVKKLMLMTAAPGNGKSTELKVTAMKLKKNFPSHWVCYVDLKKNTEVFQKDRNVSAKFTNSVEVSEYFSENILKLGKCEKIFFAELYEDNRVIFLFDGVDKISPSFKEFVLKLTVGISQTSQNHLLVASRPHLTDDLEKNLATVAFTLSKFTEENRNDFFHKFFDHFKNKKSKSENLKKCNEVVNITDRSRYGGDSILNPLLLHMIANLVLENEDFDPLSANLFSIYHDFTSKLIGKLAKKGPDAVADSVQFIQTVKIIRYHQKISFEDVFRVDKKITAQVFGDIQILSNDQLNRIGLMYGSRDGRLYFNHRTFAEFFVAEFLVEEVIKKKKSDDAILKLWRFAITKTEYGMVRRFLNDKLEGFQYEHFKASKIFKSYIWSGENSMEKSATESCTNLIKFWSISLSQNIEDSFRLWCDSKIFLSAAEHYSLPLIQDLWNFASKIFDTDQMRKLLKSEKNSERCVLNYSIRRDSTKVFEFFFHKVQESLSEEKFKTERDQIFNPNRLLWGLINEKNVSLEEKTSLVLVRLGEKFTADELRPCLFALGVDGRNITHLLFREPKTDEIGRAHV